jgi:hypothetical protein
MDGAVAASLYRTSQRLSLPYSRWRPITKDQWWALKRRKHRFILKATILYEKSNGLFTFSKVWSVNFIVPMIFSKLSLLILS